MDDSLLIPFHEITYQKAPEFSLIDLILLRGRSKKLYSHNVPNYIRVYDNGGFTTDRYTIIFTGKRVSNTEYLVLKLSDEPDDQNHNCYTMYIESTSKKNIPMIGRKIQFNNLPPQCQKVVQCYYKSLWNVN
jgi:hypothetical protein